MAEISREPDDAQSELKIALGSPAVSVILGGLFALLEMVCNALAWKTPAFVCFLLAVMNLSLVIFNMFPGYPLDGGQVLRALIWAKTGRLRHATYISSRIGIGFSWLLIVLGVYLVVRPDHIWSGIIYVLVGFF